MERATASHNVAAGNMLLPSPLPLVTLTSFRYQHATVIYSFLPISLSIVMYRVVSQREARAEEAERAGTDAMDQEEEPSPVQDSTSGESHYTYPAHRSRLLLLRSSVAAITTIISELPSFFHPYILRSLSATLVLRGVGSSTKKDDSEIKKNQNSIESSKPKFQNQKKKIPVVSRTSLTPSDLTHRTDC